MDKNIYYSPEAFGVKTVFDVDKSDGCYQFNMFAIWQGTDRYYWASDAGCSCPSPFEYVDIDSAFQGTLRDAVNDAMAWVGEYEDHYSDPYVADAKASIERFAAENNL